MIVTFRTDVPVAETMMFEDVYEDVLRVPEDEKGDLVAAGIAVWMFVDGAIAGEIYGAAPAGLDDMYVPDIVRRKPNSIYCHSTTILPPFQGRGLSKTLVAYWNGMARARGFDYVIGHATSPAMVAVRTFFGAKPGRVHENWGDTERTAVYYESPL